MFSRLEFSDLCKYLSKFGLNTATNLELLSTCEANPSSLHSAFMRLAGANLLKQDNFLLILKNSQDVGKLACGLFDLQMANILRQRTFERLVELAPHAKKIGEGLGYLSNVRMDNQDNFIFLATYAPHADFLGKMVNNLVKNNIPDNAEILVQFRDYLPEISNKFSALPVKNQENFSQIIIELQAEIALRLKNEKIALLMASHHRLGEKSDMKLFFDDKALGDGKRLLGEVLDFLPKPRDM